MKLTRIIFRPKFAPRFAPRLWFSPRKIVYTSARASREDRMGIKRSIGSGVGVLGGIALGAGFMYMFDPDRGRRRRAMVRDRVTQALHETGDAMDKGLRDLNNRVSGTVIETMSVLMPADVSDEVLRARLRSALGRTVAYPHAIEVEVRNGEVTLSGHILEQDRARLLSTVRHMRGVKGIIDELSVHAEPGDVPDLQGRPHAVREHAFQRRWTPAMRLGAAVGGSFLTIYGLSRRGLARWGYAAAGVSMALRALKAPVRCGAWPESIIEHGVHLQKTINVDAPLDRVFRMLSSPEIFPKFMSHIQSVHRISENVYRWTFEGPAGAVAHWDAEIIRLVDKELLEWKTRPGSAVQHAGVVRFDPTPYGGTRVQLRVSYRPPLGAVGEMMGELFNMYTKHVLDGDLARFKSLLEQGKTTAHHERIQLSDVG